MLDIFPICCFTKVFYFFFGLCVFYIGIFLLEKVVEFLAVCFKHFILIVLVLSSLLSRQLLCNC